MKLTSLAENEAKCFKKQNYIERRKLFFFKLGINVKIIARFKKLQHNVNWWLETLILEQFPFRQMNMASRMDCILMRNEEEKELLLPFQILQKK